MSNQKAILKVSLIPLAIIIVLILGAGYFLLQGEINLPTFKRGPTIRRLTGFPTLVYTDKEIAKQNYPVKIEQESIQTPIGMRTLRTIKVPTFDYEGNPDLLIGISSDITDELALQKQLEEEKAKAAREQN